MAFDFCFARAVPVKLLNEAFRAQVKEHFDSGGRLKFTIIDDKLSIEKL